MAFGDVAMNNAVPLPTSSEVRVRSRQYINVRLAPSTQAGVVGVLAPGDRVTALERLEDDSWLRVRLADGDTTGWLFTDLVETDDSLDTLNVAGRQSAFYEPMQAFYFTSSDDANTFNEVPSSGLLIQTPEGVGEIQLLINEVNIQIGSTVYFQAQPNGFMTVATLEGHADVSAFGYEFTAFPGTQVTIPINENMSPIAAPNPPVPYDENAMRMLPIGILKRQIEVSPAMSYEEIQATQEAQEALQNGIQDSSTSCCTATDDSTCSGPGQSCNAPGLGGSCPGNSCTNPGQGSERNTSPGKGQGQGNN
jgi:hypothetical protein